MVRPKKEGVPHTYKHTSHYDDSPLMNYRIKHTKVVDASKVIEIVGGNVIT